MLTAILASLALVVAAHFAQSALGALGKPIRAPWVFATAAAWAIPLSQVLALGLRSSPSASAPDASLPLVAIVAGVMTARMDVQARAVLDGWLIAAWSIVSLALLVRVLLARQALRHAAAQWTRGEIAGAPVWLSEIHGPAVVGVVNPEIVVPRAIAHLPMPQQTLAMEHEREHVRAHDHWLSLGALLAIATVPWNPLVWLAVRRLRIAIEIDCDARVLDAQPTMRASYATLMLNVAGWPSRTVRNGIALGESAATALGRRLRLVTSEPSSRGTVAASLRATAACVLLVVGCDISTNVPPSQRATLGQSAVQSSQQPSISDLPSATTVDGSPSAVYPASLRAAGVEGDVLVQFVVDAEGEAVPSTLKVIKSSHDLFTQAVSTALPKMRFVPTQLKGKSVRQLVQQPFAFRIAK
jgi:TonB family protein